MTIDVPFELRQVISGRDMLCVCFVYALCMLCVDFIVFSGWYLSMKPEDTYLQKLNNIEELPRMWDAKERFGTVNEKTFGVLLVSK